MAKKKVLGAEEVKNDVVDVTSEVKTETVATEREVAKKIDNDELIPCMNMTNGKLVYKSSRMGIKYTWATPGDVLELPFGELKDMSSSKGKFLRDGMLFLLDEEAVNALRLSEVYKGIMTHDEIDELFSMSEDIIKSKINSAPRAIKELVFFKARESLSDMTIKQKRSIEEALGVTLGDE